MYTAKEAREKAAQSLCEEANRQLSRVEECINEAADNGMTSTWYYGRLHGQVISKLEKLGYEVCPSLDQRDGNAYTISWEGARDDRERT